MSDQQAARFARYRTIDGVKIVARLRTGMVRQMLADKATAGLKALFDGRTGAQIAQDAAQDIGSTMDSGVAQTTQTKQMLDLADAADIPVDDLRTVHWATNINQDQSVDYLLFAAVGWNPAPDEEKVVHVTGLDASWVEKWIRQDGREYVFVRGSDGTNDGTFNYGPNTGSVWKIFTDKSANWLLDVAPWIVWGTTMGNRTGFDYRWQKFKESIGPYLKAKTVDGIVQ